MSAGRKRLWLLAGVMACSRTQPESVRKRQDTEIHHEPCDSQSPTAERIDVNGDGRPDLIDVRENGRKVCRIADLNFDGRPDVFTYYDSQSNERRRESDFDMDGKVDEITLFAAGVPSQRLRDMDGDGKLDTWDRFAGGRLVNRERDTDGDGFIDQWWSFDDEKRPQCARIYFDRNLDGKPDPSSELTSCLPGAPPSPATR